MKSHPNEIIVTKLTEEQRQKLIQLANDLGPKHIDVLMMQIKRQEQYVLVE